jgi:hypothetical protein
LIIGGQQVRTDLTIPVIKVLSETEYAGPDSTNQVSTLQPDSARFRIWSMSGVSHSDWASGIVRNAIVRRDMPNANLYDACPESRSRVPGHYIMAAAIDALKAWVRQGTPAPAAPRMTLTSVAPPAVARDEFGNVLGGIRMPTLAAPIAVDQGVGTGPALCFLNGVHRPFDTATLQRLYPSHQAYVSAITAAANQNVQQGFLLPADAAEVIAEAESSIVGKGLTCGPLCANVAQFPLNPSTSILRDQTALLYIENGQELVSLIDAATQFVAKGYTLAGQTSATSQALSKEQFELAISVLRTYVERVKALPAQNRALPVTAALLVDFGNTLIERIATTANIADPLVTPSAYGEIRVVEYFRSASAQYFWGPDPIERAALDTAGAGGGWARTGFVFNARLPQGTAAATVPVCRFYGKAGVGPTSHFFTANAQECDALKTNPNWVYEGTAFNVLPLVNGACPSNSVTVIRLWKAGATTPASRHRWVTDITKAQTLRNFEGWTIEGPVFCTLAAE